jgi:hypothetical protein
MTFGAGAAILLAQDTVQIGPEVYGHSQYDGWGTTPIESMLGGRVHFGDFSLSMAVGTAFTNAVGAAPFRGIVGLAWSPHIFATESVGDSTPAAAPSPASDPVPAAKPAIAEPPPAAEPAPASTPSPVRLDPNAEPVTEPALP